MSQAVYCASGAHPPAERVHYGLAAPLYTHFTSPIRRYADAIVHRLLAAAVGLVPRHSSLEDSRRLGDVADNCNVRHRNAQLASRASVELHTHVFFRNRSVVTDARVIRVRTNGLIVFVPKFGIEGPVFFEDDNGGAAGAGAGGGVKGGEGAGAGGKGGAGAGVLDSEGTSVTVGGVKWTVFDPMRVKIEVEALAAGRSKLAMNIVKEGAEEGGD